MQFRTGFLANVGFVLMGLVLWAGVVAFTSTVFFEVSGVSSVEAAAGAAPTASSTVVVSNSAPTIASITLNNGSAITLTANATTAISVAAQIQDVNGCADITDATATIMIYRGAITSSTCLTTANNLNCYRATVFTATSSCSASITVNTTTTFEVYCFAQATDASSSFTAQNWLATLNVRDLSNATASADSTGVELNTLAAINVTTSSINYGTLSASSTSGTTDTTTPTRLATSTNAGNSSTTLQLSANSTLTSGSNSISTSSQKYATSSFTVNVGSTSTNLSATPTTLTGFFLTSPTSTTNVSGLVFWGLHIPAGTATGTYNGVTTFTSVFQE